MISIHILSLPSGLALGRCYGRRASQEKRRGRSRQTSLWTVDPALLVDMCGHVQLGIFSEERPALRDTIPLLLGLPARVVERLPEEVLHVLMNLDVARQDCVYLRRCFIFYSRFASWLRCGGRGREGGKSKRQSEGAVLRVGVRWHLLRLRLRDLPTVFGDEVMGPEPRKDFTKKVIHWAAELEDPPVIHGENAGLHGVRLLVAADVHVAVDAIGVEVAVYVVGDGEVVAVRREIASGVVEDDVEEGLELVRDANDERVA